MGLLNNLRSDPVHHLEPTLPLQVAVHCSIAGVVELMRAERVGCVLVCEDSTLVGIFTERDLLTRVLSQDVSFAQPVQDVMTPQPVTVQAQDSIHTAVQRMERGGYRHLPVVDEQQHPVGIVSIKQVIHYLVEHFPAIIYNLPPDPDAIPHQREGA